MFNLFKKKDPEPIPEPPKKEQWMMYNLHVHGLDHKNKNGDNILRFIRDMAKEYDDGAGYYSLKKSDFKEDPWLEVGEMDSLDSMDGSLEVTEFEGKTAVKVYVDDYLRDGMTDIGWIPADQAEDVAELLKAHDCKIEIKFDGGKMKHLDEEDNLEIEDRPIFVDVNIYHKLDNE